MYLFMTLFVLSFVGLEIWFLKYDRLLSADPLFFDIFKYCIIPAAIFFVYVVSYNTYQVVYSSEDELRNEQQKSEQSK